MNKNKIEIKIDPTKRKAKRNQNQPIHTRSDLGIISSSLSSELIGGGDGVALGDNQNMASAVGEIHEIDEEEMDSSCTKKPQAFVLSLSLSKFLSRAVSYR